MSSRKKRVLFFLSILIVLIPTLILLLKSPNKAEAGWWNEGWLYRKPISISSSSGSTEDRQILLNEVDVDGLYSDGKVKSDCSDIRFTTQDGREIEYWIEDENDSADTLDCTSSNHDIWIRVPPVPAGGTRVYMYYGNPSAGSKSNGTATFEFFDDFNSSTLDSYKWDGTGGSLNISGGNLELATASGTEGVASKDSFDPSDGGYLYIRAKQSATSLNAARIGFSNTKNLGFYFWTDDSAGFLFDSTTGGSFETESVNDAGSFERSTVSPSEDTSFHLFRVTPTAGFEIDGGVGTIHLSQVPDEPMYVRLENTSTSGTMYIDHTYFVKSGSLVTPGTPGTEESGPGPILWLRFDEGMDNTCSDGTSDACDSSSIGTNLVNSGGEWRSEDYCVAGKCVFFDGSDSSFNVSSPDTFDFAGTDPFTIQAWFKHSGPASTIRVITTNWDTSNNDGGFYMSMQADGTIYFRIDDDDADITAESVASAESYDDDQWHMATAVKDGTNSMKLYVDGKLVDSDTSLFETGPLANNDTFYVGSFNATSGEWLGFIDEVKVYPYSRSLDEIKTDYQKGVSTLTGSSTVLGAPNKSFINKGLVGYWPFDDSSIESESEITTDYSGNGNNGTLYGDNGSSDNGSGMDSSAGRFGNAKYFDGTDDYINMGSDSSLDDIGNGTNGDGLTMGTWIKHTNGQNDMIAVKADNCTPIEGWCFWVGWDGTLHFEADYTGDNLSRQSTQTVPENEWTYVAVTWDGSPNASNVHLYINGEETSYSTTTDGTLSRVSDASKDLVISWGTGGAAFIGSIEDMRLYNRTLSSSEISDLYNWAPPPRLYFDFEETPSSTTVIDKSGVGNDGTLNNMETTDWVAGKFGNGIKLDGSEEKIIVDSSWENDMHSYSAMAWVNYASLEGNLGASTDTVLFKRISGDNSTPRVTIDNADGEVMHMVGINSVDIAYGTSTAIGINNWHHIAVTFDGNTNTGVTYVDGVATTYTFGAGTLDTGTTDFEIGYDSYESRWMNGIIDEVKVYDYERTATQIIEDMNGGYSLGAGSQIVYYKFEEMGGDKSYDHANNNNLDFAGSTNTCPGGSVRCPSWSTQGKFGNALSLDGVNDYGTIYEEALENIESLSIAAWVKVSSFGDEEYLIHSGNESDETEAYNDAFFIRWDTTSGNDIEYGHEYGAGNDSFHVFDANLSTDTWYHIAVIRNIDTNTVKLYVNGKQVDSTYSYTYDPTGSTTSNVNLGSKQGGNSGYFHGLMDEFKIYQGTLTPEQILIDMNGGTSSFFGGTSTEGTGPATNSAAYASCVPGSAESCGPPIAWWSFDENTGTTTLRDKSGNGYDGTMSSITETDWRVGKYGSALSFDGSEDHIVLPAIALGGDTGTISAWFKVATLPTTGEYQNIVGRAYDSGTLQIAEDSGDVVLVFRAKGNYCASYNTEDLIEANKWYHAIGTYDGSTKYIYLNGQLIHTCAQTGNWDDEASAWAISAYDGGDPTDQFFDGIIDELKMYDYAFTPAQAAWEYNKGKPIAQYKLDECEGSTARDSSGNGYNGVITIGSGGGNNTAGTCNSGTSTQAWNNGTDGKYNASLDFDGSNDYITISDVDALDIDANDSITVEAWVSRDTYNTTDVILAKDNNISTNSTDGYALYVSASDKVTFTAGDGSNGVYGISTKTITTTDWTHIAAVLTHPYSGANTANVKLYINGMLDGTGNGTLVAPDNALNLRIGAESDGGEPFDGQLDSVKIYNYPLTQQQILTSYNQGSAIRFGD